ncbi:Hypothetical protein PHPALM_14278 [Phytophthora palmivora]|uniref:Uncharacterized protein n=1 Tax=Phytophthora palmivora TaxID=4796 RepID=A0A2P4XV48_9STRA|nr:Hypothetical protein PHPALM_14278 [Phytophthora palmivora]
MKFTTWTSKCKALGLLYDTEAGNVSIPIDKLYKAENRVNKLLNHRQPSTCCKLSPTCSLISTSSTKRRKHVSPISCRSLSTEVLDDLCWFRAILQHPEKFNKSPVANFSSITLPSFHKYTDASGEGLCVLEPTRRELFVSNLISVNHSNYRSTPENFGVLYSLGALLIGVTQYKNNAFTFSCISITRVR